MTTTEPLAPVAANRATATTPTWGTRADQFGALRAGLLAAAVVSAYVAAAHLFAPQFVPSRLEALGTATSLACVWLTRRQNIWSMPYGIVSVLAMGSFFFQIDLVGQGWLHLGFYVPVQIAGWYLWLRGGPERDELAVTQLTAAARTATVVAVVAGSVVLAQLFAHLHGPTPYPLWDATIVAASVAAQVLLTMKRTESWLLWLLPVNALAVGLYLRTDADLFAALYALYFLHALAGLRDWTRAARAHRRGLSAFEVRHVV